MSVRIHPTAIIEDGVELGAGSVGLGQRPHPARRAHRRGVHRRREDLHRLRRADRRPREDQRHRLHLRGGDDRGRRDDQRRHDLHQRPLPARRPRRTCEQLRPSDPDEHTLPTLVREGATIGAGCTIGNDLTIGRFAMVGMGSLVTQDRARLPPRDRPPGGVGRLRVPLRRAHPRVPRTSAPRVASAICDGVRPAATRSTTAAVTELDRRSANRCMPASCEHALGRRRRRHARA